jgi:hypothetical protein
VLTNPLIFGASVKPKFLKNKDDPMFRNRISKSDCESKVPPVAEPANQVGVNHFMSAGVTPWPNLPLLSLTGPFIARAV